LTAAADTPERNPAGDFLWTVGLLGYPIEERIEAAAKAGFTSMSANVWELEEQLNEGGEERLRALRSQAAVANVRLAVLEAVVTWLPAVDSAILPRVDLETVERIGDLVGVEALLAIGYAEPSTSTAAIAEAFGPLCDRAARHGWLAALEFTPNSAVKSLAAARDVLRQADRDNARIVFDTWHFFRGDPDWDVLRDTDGDLISHVQVSDAGLAVEKSMVEDAWNRKLPGDGEFDLVRVLGELEAIGALRSIGPEVNRPHTPELSCFEAVTEMATATAGVLGY
jgi:sugar phosphate isomerase/epimerase